MIISKRKKALILRLRDPQRVLSVIPTAKLFSYQGKEYVAVKHGRDETKVLRNIGIMAPAPIMHHYNWPARFTPFNAQREAAAFMTLEDRAFNLSDLGCVDSETEYLSPTGWRRIADYERFGGEVAQYHPDTGTAEFVTPTQFVKLPCSEMIRVKTKYGVDQLLSPEHRMLVRDRLRQEKYEVVQAAELMVRQENWIAGVPPVYPPNRKLGHPTIAYSGCTIPATFHGSGGSGIPMTDAQLRVQIAVIADGHFPNKGNTCVVRLKKERKKVRLRKLLADAGIEWRERESTAPTAQGFHVFSFSAPTRDKVFDESYWAATIEQLYVICDEVMHWDGSDRATQVKSGKGFQFSSCRKESADFVQYAYSATGRVARLVEGTRDRREGTETEYTVNVRLNGNVNLQIKGSGANGKYRAMSFAPSTDGFKYCFTVPSTFLILRRNGCVFASGNTGKTMATLWAYDYLRSIGHVRKAIVVTPLSTLERTWADEVFNHFPHLNAVVLYGTREKRLKLLETDADLYLINHDGIKVSGFLEALAHRPDIDLVIVDEVAQVARTAGTERYTALREICNRQTPRKVWGLTGTPTPNSPTDAWAQCRLLVPHRVPPYFNKFRDQVMRQVNQFLWVPRDNSLEVVHEAMQPAIRFKRDECVDLPPCMFETREAHLTDEQKKAYRDMLTRLRIEHENGGITAVNEAVKAQKLIQVACGAVYDGDGGELLLDVGPRMDVLMEIIEQAAAKVIVFAPFVAVVGRILDHVRAEGYTAEAIHGGVSKNERDRIFTAFQKGAEPRVLVAQPAAMSHGLTLTAANTIVWFAPIASNDTFEQANARITRPGQKHSQLIVTIEGTDIERRYYQRLKNKQKVQGLLLDMVQNARAPA